MKLGKEFLFLFLFASIVTNKLVFKEDLSDCSQMIFTVKICILKKCSPKTSFESFQGLMVLGIGFHHQILF